MGIATLCGGSLNVNGMFSFDWNLNLLDGRITMEFGRGGTGNIFG